MMNRVVVLDVEAIADRSDVTEHEVIEIGACLVDENGTIAEFSTFVAPQRSVPASIVELTGITDEMLVGAPKAGDALDRLREFVGDCPLLAYNGEAYDFPVLDAACRRADRPLLLRERLDILDLAHLAFPRSGDSLTPGSDGTVPPVDRSLATIGRHLGIAEPQARHRALADALLAADVLAALLDRVNEPSPARRLQRWVLAHGRHPWAVFLRDCETREPLDVVVPDVPDWQAQDETTPLDVDAVVAHLEPGGAILGKDRTSRPQQVDMARLVLEGLARGRRRMVEAPTGTGKTLAYLVPAVAVSRATGAPVVVATHSKVLQNQVLTSFVDLEPAFGPVRWVLLKGRENYISLDALDAALDSSALEPDEAFALAVLCAWVAETPTGEWDDLRVWAVERRHPAFAALRWRLRVDQRPGIPVEPLQRKCFYRRALARLHDCEVAVLNHAVLVSNNDWMDGAVRVVIDEAHNLEEAATLALSEEVTHGSLRRLFDGIHEPERRWGLLGRYLDATGTAASDTSVVNVRAALDEARSASIRFGDALVEYVRGRSGARRADVERFGTAYRLRAGSDTHRADYQATRRAALRLAHALRVLSAGVADLPVPATVRSPYRRHRLEQEQARVAREGSELADLVVTVTHCRGDGEWICIADLVIADDAWQWGLRRVPLSVAPALTELWDGLVATVLTSATLTVGGDFSHLIDRLGLPGTEPFALPTPFTRLHENELLVLPDHLPAPRGNLLDEFTEAQAGEIARMLLLTAGRGLVLFTSTARMNHTRDYARPLLDEQDLPLLCQGDAPSPALVERMRTERATSLLATRSFWEGIDVPGESLSLLVIEKLPFDSPGDPVVAARMDAVEMRGRDPFGEYLVPQAVIRFVQGVGRLIRSEHDVGVVVVLDKRLRRPVAYRERFLRSLPGPPTIARPISADEAYRAIAAHLGITFDGTMGDRLRAVAGPGPWGDLDSLALGPTEAEDPNVRRERVEAVRERFGFSSWRPGQLEVIERFVAGEDVLAVLPTGSGKSLTFQLPALLCPGLTLVVAPLVALMRDQVQAMHARGILAVQGVYSGQPQSEQDEILDGAAKGRYKLLYVSPERLWSRRFRQALRGVPVARVAIDEAHCISQWGHSFRPEYTAIREAVRELAAEHGRPPVLAVTATATEQVRNEVAESLGLELRRPPVVRTPDRSELQYFVEDCVDRDDRDLRIVQVVEAFRGLAAIVFVPRRADAVRVATLLRAANHVARPYHGGMEPERRVHVEEAFRYGEVDVVVATKAFGLGIDKADISLVVHQEMPASIEEFVQETGRAARGASEGVGPSVGTCVLMRTPRDCSIHRQFVRSAAPTLETIKAVWDVLQAGETYSPPDELLGSSGDRSEPVELAVHHLIVDGAVERLGDITWAGRVWVPDNWADLLEKSTLPPGEITAMARLLRAVHTFGSEEFALRPWSSRLGMRPEELERRLLELQRADVIGFSAWKSAWHLRPRGTEPEWQAIEARCEKRRDHVAALAGEARAFARDDATCRRARMIRYLGIAVADRCDACDVCRPDLPRRWRASPVTREALAAALPAREVALAMLADLRWTNFSVRTVARALAGIDRPHPPPAPLAEHPSFGRLALLGLDQVVVELKGLAEDGLVELVDAVGPEETPYRAIRITRDGYRRV